MRNSHLPNTATGAPLRHWIFAAILLLLVSGCSLPSFFGPSEPPPNANAEMLYKEGLDYLARKRYVNAIDRFQRVKADYPFAQEVLMAELKLSEAYYLNEQYPEAIEALKEFIGAHASSEHVPYALYMVGMAHFDQFTGSDRDQKLTEIAKGYFEKVAKEFPKSPYAPQAREKLAKCLEYLAEHEFIVASFYIGEKKYPAAQDRLEDLLRKYKETSAAPKALYQLGESYRLEKNNSKAGLAYEALLHYYPNHPLAKTAQSQLSQLTKEKQDPLAALLKRERRPLPAAAPPGSGQPAVPGAEAPAEASRPKDLNLVAKTEVVNEDPGSQRSFLSRLNPFSSSPPPPEKTEAKKEEPKPQPAATKSEPAKSEGFFSSLWRGINPFSSKAEAKPSATTGSPQVVGDIDQSLKALGAAQGAKPSAPKTELPVVAEAPPPPDAQAVLGSVDATLGKKGVSTANLPPPPETASALKTTDAERAAERSRPASGPAVDSGFVSKLDEALKQRGIDPAKIEAARTQMPPPPAGARPLVARPKPEPQIQLEPRLGTERKGPLLGAQEFQPQEKPAALKEADLASGAEAKPPAPPAEPEQLRSLPQAVVTGPPKEKPAETKSAAKKSDAEPEEKGILDQLKEDAGRIGNILNPFKW